MSHEVAVNNSMAPENASLAKSMTRPPVYMTLSNVSMTLKNDPARLLLNGVSVTFGPGLNAIMGPTGAGKSCLMNSLAGLVADDYVITGDRRLNGKSYTASGVHYGYVYQTDDLNGNLTVWETMAYAAELQLAQRTPAQRNERIEELLRELGLFYVKDTLVGSVLKKGISGGQRKRVSIALALLTNPSLILMDEPTAGLDSVTALNLLDYLKSLAGRGCTIICVIHQPQRAIYELLDRLLLIRSGELIYDGGAAAAVPFFESLGYLYDGTTNPADFIVEMISPQLGESLAALDARCLVKKSYQKPEIDSSPYFSLPVPRPEEHPSWGYQFQVLARRQIKQELRAYSVHVLNFFTTMGNALFIGGVYYKMSTMQSDASLRLAALFFCTVNQSLFGAMKVILDFPDQRVLMLRERRMKMYTASPCCVAWFCVELLFNMPWSVLFAVTTYFMIGFIDIPASFFLYWFILLLDKMCAGSLAQAIIAISRSTVLATMILPAGLEISRLFSGFFMAPKVLPNYFKWLDPLSYVKYAYVGVALNELHERDFHCPLNGSGVPVCKAGLPVHGQDLIKSLGLDYINIGGCVACLVGYVLICRLIAYWGLRKLKW